MGTSDSYNATAQELVDVIGEEATAKLCSRLGGLRVSIGPMEELLREVVGYVATSELIEHWGSERVHIPRRTLNYGGRRELAQKMREEGYTILDISLQMDVSERSVYRYLADEPVALPASPTLALPKPDERQGA